MVKPKQFILQEKNKPVDSIIGTDYVILFQKALTDITFSASYFFHHPTHFIWTIHCNTTKKENQMETKIAKPVSTCHSCRKSDLNHIYNWTNLLKIFLLILDYWVDFHNSLCYGAQMFVGREVTFSRLFCRYLENSTIACHHGRPVARKSQRWSIFPSRGNVDFSGEASHSTYTVIQSTLWQNQV